MTDEVLARLTIDALKLSLTRAAIDGDIASIRAHINARPEVERYRRVQMLFYYFMSEFKSNRTNILRLFVDEYGLRLGRLPYINGTSLLDDREFAECYVEKLPNRSVSSMLCQDVFDALLKRHRDLFFRLVGKCEKGRGVGALVMAALDEDDLPLGKAALKHCDLLEKARVEKEGDKYELRWDNCRLLLEPKQKMIHRYLIERAGFKVDDAVYDLSGRMSKNLAGMVMKYL